MIALFAIFVLGVVVRLLGVRLGLPFWHHWDEVWVVASAKQMLRDGSDVPTSYQYGAPHSRLIVFAVRALGGIVKIPPNDEAGLRWVGRIVGIALSSTGTLACYIAGKHATLAAPERRVRVGLYAATLYAVAYELVTHARYAVTDAPYVAFAAWSLAFACVYATRRTFRYVVLSVFAAGVAFAFKPTAAPTVLIPFAALIIFRPTRESSRWVIRKHRAILVGMVPCYMACFVFFNPHFVDRWHAAWGDVSMRILQAQIGNFPKFLLYRPGPEHLAIASWGLVGHTLSRYVPIAVFLSAISMLGVVVSVRERYRAWLPGALHAIVTLLLLTSLSQTFLLRNYLVVVPAICIAFGIGLDSLQTWIATLRPTRFPSLVVAAIPLVAAVASTSVCAGMAQWLSQDARVRAMDFVAAAPDHGPIVGYSQGVVGIGALGSTPQAVRALKRPGISHVQVPDCSALSRTKAMYAVIASYRGGENTWRPYVHQWHFEVCPGWRAVATFEDNPYEHTYWVTETWEGRSKAIVLRRQ